MNLIKQHEEAMKFSFLAKQARDKGEEDQALDLYLKSAELESEVAEYYLDKPELEPTRSILIRSAGFLNLKDGILEKAEKFILWGLVNIKDDSIKNQLYEAFELCNSFRNLNRGELSANIDYIYKTRQRSVYYSIEPQTPEYGTAVTLEMVSDFSNNYTKSLKAFSKSKHKDYFPNKFISTEEEEIAADKFQRLINPIITNASFGSFKFSIAADWLPRVGESREFTKLKSNILINYHNEIFTNELTKDNIEKFKEAFSEDEIDQIFRPLFNIKSNKADYKVSYYDRDNFKKSYVGKAKNSQKSQLLPVKKINVEDIGQLENTIIHKRTTQKGTSSRSIILKQELRFASFDFRTNILEPKNQAAIILNQEIIINVGFNSEIGFHLSYDELPIEVTGTIFNDSLSEFFTKFILLIKRLRDISEKTLLEEKYWAVIRELTGNPEGIS